ncbi:hypothetical protein ACO0LG_16730 [Undibacterium sp. Ji42W]|uniref:hypothetical protein n=1 Tax=Undibacterium sp. Ji42W TaxID=3413039 RepID=UPI003BF41EAE
MRNLQNLKVADNVLTGSAAVACRGTVPDCDLAIRQANLLNGKEGNYGMNIDFHLAKKEEPVAFTMDIMDDAAFQKIAGKDTGGDYLNGVLRLPRNHDYITTKHEVLHAMGRGHEKFKNLDLSNRPGIMSYASDFIRSPGPGEKDYKILVDNYRNYPARQEEPRSIWDFWRK